MLLFCPRAASSAAPSTRSCRGTRRRPRAELLLEQLVHFAHARAVGGRARLERGRVRREHERVRVALLRHVLGLAVARREGVGLARGDVVHALGGSARAARSRPARAARAACPQHRLIVMRLLGPICRADRSKTAPSILKFWKKPPCCASTQRGSSHAMMSLTCLVRCLLSGRDEGRRRFGDGLAHRDLPQSDGLAPDRLMMV